MMFETWIEEGRGRAAMLAGHFGVTPSAVSQWRENGVPRNHMVAVRDLSAGDVSLEEMLGFAEARSKKLVAEQA